MMSTLGFRRVPLMNGKAGRRRVPRHVAAVAAVAAAVAALTAGCGVHVSFGNGTDNGSAATGSTYQQELAFAHCMQTHGVPNFPEPSNANQGFGVSGTLNGPPTGPLAEAHNACAHLLPNGTSTTGTGTVTEAQLAQAVKLAQCLRAHGEPTFPDPTVQNGSIHFTVQQGVLQSTQFQKAKTACSSLIPKGVKFP